MKMKKALTVYFAICSSLVAMETPDRPNVGNWTKEYDLKYVKIIHTPTCVKYSFKSAVSCPVKSGSFGMKVEFKNLAHPLINLNVNMTEAEFASRVALLQHHTTSPGYSPAETIWEAVSKYELTIAEEAVADRLRETLAPKLERETVLVYGPEFAKHLPGPILEKMYRRSLEELIEIQHNPGLFPTKIEVQKNFCLVWQNEVARRKQLAESVPAAANDAVRATTP
jgi:hypothetical protein